MTETETEWAASSGRARLALALQLLILLLIVASPWPFGSATPRPAAVLTGSLYLLFGIWVAYLLASGNITRVTWPAWPWVVAGLFLGLLQLAPLPGAVLRWIAPLPGSIRSPEVPALVETLSRGFVPISIEPFATTAEWLRLGALAASFFLSSQLFSERRSQKILASVVATVGVAVGLFAVYQKARWGTLLYGRYPVDSGTPYGPFVNHNHFAGWVEMSALFAMGGAVAALRRSPARTILLGGSALLMGVALVLSQSRGGMLASAAGALLMGERALKGKARAPVAAFGAWVAALVLLFLVVAPASSIRELGKRWAAVGSPTHDRSVDFRLSLWSDSARLARGSPFLGTGLGTFAAAIPPFRRDGDEIRAEFAESDLVQLGCEAGLAGLAVLLGFVFSLGRGAAGNLTFDGGGALRIGAAASAVALLVHGVFDFNARVPANAFLLSVLLGVLAGRLPRARAGATWSAGFRYASAASALALTLALAFAAVRLGLSREEAREVDPRLARPEGFATLAERLARAQALAPGNPEVSFKWGQLYTEEAYRAKDHARYRSARFEQARGAFEQAIRLAPARGRHWFELAWTEANLRRDERAAVLFEHAVRLEPSWSRLRANYALYLASRARIEPALAQLEIARRLKPGLAPEEAVAILGPFVGDDPAILRRAAGSGPEGEKALAQYLSERR